MTGLRPFVAENKSEHERNTDSNLTPSGNFHRRLHWVVKLFSDTKLLRGGGGAPVPSFKNQVYTYTQPAEKETISKPNHTILMKLCMWIESADV